MKRIGWLCFSGLLFISGCLPGEVGTGLPTVGCNQMGTPPRSTTAWKNLPAVSSDLAGKVFFVGRTILARNVNCGLDPQATFITYPSPDVEIFHVDRTQVFVTEGLARKCDADQLAAVLALELGKMAAERIVASPYLDARDLQGPVHLEAGRNEKSSSGFEIVELVRGEGQQRSSREVRPDPRKLAAMFLEKADYARSCLAAAQPILEEAGLHHQVERRVKGLPSQVHWTSD